MPAPAAVAPPAIAPARFDWAAWNPLADLRVRYGIKVGIAGVLTLWIAQTLRLEHANWSILAALVLANAHFVGAIATRALMRSLGTVAGALLGIWVVGDYTNSPLIFLSLVFVVVAISTYKSGQIASGAWPYAYYLVGLTLVLAATYGVSDPDTVWRYGLYRCVETLVGVVCATFVYSLLWPRYAREEFVVAAGKALRTVRALMAADACSYASEAVDPTRVVDLRRTFSQQIVELRTLLASGGRGSSYFRARLGNYQHFVVALTQLFQASLELQRRRTNEDELVALIRPEVDRYVAALDRDLGVLGDMASTRRGLPPTELAGAFDELEARVKALREQGAFRQTSVSAGAAFFGHFAALRQLRDELTLVHEIAGELPRRHLPVASVHKRREVLPVVDRFWVKEAIKAGIATCLSFLLVKWVHPPGASSIPLGAWVFSSFGRRSLTTGGTGDLRGFQRMFLTALTGIPIVALLWLVMPLLSNYWAMNTLLFVLCYAFGFIVVGTAAISYPMQIMVLSISALVGINPQQPVAFGTLRDSFLGLIIGLVIGGTVSRVLWPVLPQGSLRSNLIEFFEDLRTLLGGTDEQEFFLTGAMLLPLGALQAVDALVLPRSPLDERDQLANFVRTTLPLGMQIAALRDTTKQPLSPPIEERLREPAAALERQFDEFLDKLARCFRDRTTAGDFPNLGVTMDAVDAAVTKVRDEGVGASENFESVAHLLDLVDRYHSVTEQLRACQNQLAKLNLHRYLGDVSL